MTGRVRIPADIDRPDRILAGLTGRQLAILAVTGLLVWAGYTVTRGLLPAAVFAGLAAPVALAGAALALGIRDGLSGDRFALAAWRHHRSATRRVLAPEGVPAPPAWAAPADDRQPPAPLELPAGGIDGDGVVDLGADGAALLCRAGALTFALRTDDEQQALIGAFGRWLNSLAGCVQVVVRAERADLRPAIAALRDAAPGLPHPALETAAAEHADFLVALAARTDVLTRQILVVLREPTPADTAAPVLARRAADAATALAAAGITLTVLDASQAAHVLAGAADTHGPERPTGLAATDGVITGARP